MQFIAGFMYVSLSIMAWSYTYYIWKLRDELDADTEGWEEWLDAVSKRDVVVNVDHEYGQKLLKKLAENNKETEKEN